MSTKNCVYDIGIVGAGVVGLTLANALEATGLKVLLIDSKANFSLPENVSTKTARVSAISRASERVFQALGVWPQIAEYACAYQGMHVWNDEGKIDFSSQMLAEPNLGHIVPNEVMSHFLWQTLTKSEQVTFIEGKPNQLERVSDHWTLALADGQQYPLRLLVGADGARSWVREKLGVAMRESAYGQDAIVATIKTEKPHAARCYQRFLPTGPLAFLPLPDLHHCSIVWSLESITAKEKMALTDEDFCAALSEASECCLGEVKSIDKRVLFPLLRRHVKNYVGEGFALVGDAAHGVHPLAGQGMNLGILDAVYLAEVIAASLQRKKNFASEVMLTPYQRRQKSQNSEALLAMEAFHRLFTAKLAPLPLLRNKGLQLADGIPLLKRFFMATALGDRADLPAIAKKTGAPVLVP